MLVVYYCTLVLLYGVLIELGLTSEVNKLYCPFLSCLYPLIQMMIYFTDGNIFRLHNFFHQELYPIQYVYNFPSANDMTMQAHTSDGINHMDCGPTPNYRYIQYIHIPQPPKPNLHPKLIDYTIVHDVIF